MTKKRVYLIPPMSEYSNKNYPHISGNWYYQDDQDDVVEYESLNRSKEELKYGYFSPLLYVTEKGRERYSHVMMEVPEEVWAYHVLQLLKR